MRTYLGGGGDKQAATAEHPTNHPSPKAQIVVNQLNSSHDAIENNIEEMQQKLNKVTCLLINSNDFYKLIFSDEPTAPNVVRLHNSFISLQAREQGAEKNTKWTRKWGVMNLFRNSNRHPNRARGR